MTFDIHIHTKVSSACSCIDPKELIIHSKKIGLGGLFITEHDSFLGGDVVKEIAEKYNFTVFSGIELRCKEGDLLIYGYRDKFPKLPEASKIIDVVHKNGGLAIPAHPFRAVLGWYLGNPPIDPIESEIFKKVIAIEVSNGGCKNIENLGAKIVAEKLNKIGVGGSDAHRLEEVGKIRICFDKEIKKEKEFVNEIKARRFVIVENNKRSKVKAI